jgi:penicillin amidase
LDTTTEIYEFYRSLVRQLLTPSVLQQKPILSDAYRLASSWNGKADADSTGLGLLMEFRKQLAQSVFTPFLSLCREKDERFVYDGDLDTPLRAILTAQAPQLLPDPDHFTDWKGFLLHVLERSVEALMEKHDAVTLDELTWGTMNRVQMTHPLAEALPGLGLLLNMPDEAAPGCDQCVRVMSGSLAASERMVISPGHHGDGILQMPGGQSAHPLSPHYRDQHSDWSQGISSPWLAGPPAHHLVLTPVSTHAL